MAIGEPTGLKSEEEKTETEKRLKRIFALERKLTEKIQNEWGKIFGTESYTGLGNIPIGQSTSENSPAAGHQLIFLLAIADNQLVENFANSEKPSDFKEEDKEQKEFFKELVENKILNGFKVLDLGCGHEPTFARIARAMGADVYTVDRFGADKFKGEGWKEFPDEESHKIEVEKHIKLDLEDLKAVKIIKEKTGGEFDLVTEAHLDITGFWGGAEIAESLLKRGGIHFNATSWGQPEIKE